MQIRSLNHVALLVSDVEQSRRFYGQILQMQEIPRPANFSFPGAWFRRGDAEVHLIGEQQPGRVAAVYSGYNADELGRGYGVHLAFVVDDLDAVQAYLDDRNVPIVGGPRPRGDGVDQLYICDPDGYVIELCTALPG